MRVIRVAPGHGETTASSLQNSLTARQPRLRERVLALALITADQPAKLVARPLRRVITRLCLRCSREMSAAESCIRWAREDLLANAC
jgi:hypothetical protein